MRFIRTPRARSKTTHVYPAQQDPGQRRPATAATFQWEDQCPFVDPSRAFENCYGGRPRQVFLMKDF
jgi:hypothetical protein